MDYAPIEVPAEADIIAAAATFRADGKREDAGPCWRVRFASMAEMAEHAARHAMADRRRASGWRSLGQSWQGVQRMARGDGWTAKAAEVTAIADKAIATAQGIVAEDVRTMRYDISGEVVDMGVYVTGAPECMIDFPYEPATAQGRVVTLVLPLCASASISAEELVQRGVKVAGVVEAVERMGYSAEVIADYSSGEDPKRGAGSVQVTLKGATDRLDMPGLLFAVAHPAALRMLAFGVWDGSVHRDAQGFGYGIPRRPAPRPGQTVIPLNMISGDRGPHDVAGFVRQALEAIEAGADL